jgi:hypothetical protein
MICQNHENVITHDSTDTPKNQDSFCRKGTFLRKKKATTQKKKSIYINMIIIVAVEDGQGCGKIRRRGGKRNQSLTLFA